MFIATRRGLLERSADGIVSARGVLAVAGVERSKLAAQNKVRLVLLACVVSPFAFAAAIRL